MTKFNKSVKDSTYGDAPPEPDIDQDELKRLCSDYVSRLKVTEQQQQKAFLISFHLMYNKSL